MNTDRELLELAAKAAGIEGKYGYAPDDYYYNGNVEGVCTELPDGRSYVWNPLTDDGDALRLAVRLRIELKFGGVSTRIPANVAVSYPEKISSASEKQILLVEQYVPGEMFTSVDSRFGESDRRFAEYHVENYGTTVGVMAATRRAIVRAAAEIGRNMK